MGKYDLQFTWDDANSTYAVTYLANLGELAQDPENEDYTLQAGSPCIDAGTADIDGDGVDDITDYYGTAPDMGAYEYEYLFQEADVTGDGIVNIQDLILIIDFIFEVTEPEQWQFTAGDVDMDGNLTILDLIYIIIHRILAG